MMTDGGTLEKREVDEYDCANLSGDLSCWPCHRDGKDGRN